ncbi:MAG TPA: YARHG domain-containing protein [Bacteroidia bacterium]|nr:YARHG domain-containing protein [Bacteroidia bacterium]
MLTILTLVSSLTLHANDGVFHAQGNHLVPVKETVVQLKKEILKLKRLDDYMAVDVYFEFFNPGPEKTEIVGFVTPPAGGDVSDSVAQHPQIRGFSAVVNGQSLPFKIARMEDTGFQYMGGEELSGYDFVYYFDVKFKPGLNVIRHRYEFRGGGSVELEYDFGYRLTTGNTWANGEIGDFTLEIDMGERALFTLPWSFGTNDAPAQWKLLGEGKMGKAADSIFESLFRSVYLRSGAVQLKALHFHPERDLGINGFNLINQAYVWGRPDLSTEVYEWLPCVLFAGYDGECLGDATDLQLRLMRNFLFAKYGLPFKSKDLTDYFGQFIWYDPIEGLTAEGIRLEDWEAESLKAILSEEAKRK